VLRTKLDWARHASRLFYSITFDAPQLKFLAIARYTLPLDYVSVEGLALICGMSHKGRSCRSW